MIVQIILASRLGVRELEDSEVRRILLFNKVFPIKKLFGQVKILLVNCHILPVALLLPWIHKQNS